MARSSSVVADGGADDRAERAERLGAVVEAAQVVEHPAGDGAAVVGARVLDLRALLVGGQREHEHAGVVARARSRRTGRSEPKPRYGLTVIASAASGEAGSR